MDRRIRTYALALLLALLLAPGAGAATVPVVQDSGVIIITDNSPKTAVLQAVGLASAAIEIVPIARGDDMIIITDDSPDTAAYIIAYPTTPASVIEEDEAFTISGKGHSHDATDYITIYPATSLTAAKAGGSAAPPVYGAATEKTATRTQPAVPVLSFSRYYSLDVTSPEKTLWVDMRWEGDGDHALTVYHPGGILGTFRDGSDGKEDGRIFLRFSREGGVAAGAWTFKMTTPLVASRENVTFQTYLE
ncbi:MAG: hypothetical protein PHP59_04560 [Methanofollis sp.]|uniref:hypothetical protein n=1 Tax=Methanofollis sp. TaxID=2052835 RepID=UPI002634EA29|nr:hypothetical protein [Methanofollis sp.]MDD4254632.1 hypothetical protein [Methanofollis sp.]